MFTIIIILLRDPAIKTFHKHVFLLLTIKGDA